MTGIARTRPRRQPGTERHICPGRKHLWGQKNGPACPPPPGGRPAMTASRQTRSCEQPRKIVPSLRLRNGPSQKPLQRVAGQGLTRIHDIPVAWGRGVLRIRRRNIPARVSPCGGRVSDCSTGPLGDPPSCGRQRAQGPFSDGRGRGAPRANAALSVAERGGQRRFTGPPRSRSVPGGSCGEVSPLPIVSPTRVTVIYFLRKRAKEFVTVDEVARSLMERL